MPTGFILAEANQWPADVRPYFGDGDECHMAFHFPLMPRIYMALRQEDRLPITDIMAQTPPIPDNCQWGLFLRNHDELTLEMVTDDERDYMYFAYSADPRMRVNVGIRRRLAPLVDNNRRRIELLNSLLLSFPGTPILYYGDEIGMGDNIYLGDRNGVRTPMQWNSDRNAGFSRCDPARLYFPVVMDPIYGYQVVNVEAQLSDQSSLLHWTRNMIALRKLFQVFGRGTLTISEPGEPQGSRLSARPGPPRRFARDGAMRGQPQPVRAAGLARSGRFRRHGAGGDAGVRSVSHHHRRALLADRSLPIRFSGSNCSPPLWRRNRWLSRKLRVSLTLQNMRRPPSNCSRKAGPACSAVPGWPCLKPPSPPGSLYSDGLEPKRGRFGPREYSIGRSSRRPLPPMAACRLLPAFPPGNAIPPVLFYVEIAYSDGPGDIYQIPLAFSTETVAADLTLNNPQNILITFPTPFGPAVLHDAVTREDFRQGVLALIERNGTLSLSTTRVDNMGLGTRLAAEVAGGVPWLRRRARIACSILNAQRTN